MDQEQLITQFNKVIDKRTRDKEAFISRLLIEFSLNPSLVEKGVLYFLQQVLRKKENSRARLSKKIEEKSKLLCKILKEITTSDAGPSMKLNFIENIMKYCISCTKSKYKKIRVSIIEFLLLLQNYKIPEIEGMSDSIKRSIYLLLNDTNSSNRKLCLRLAKKYEMYEDIYNLIEYDSIAANRKFGIKLLTPNNAQNDVFTIN